MKAEEEEGLKLFTNKPKKATARGASSSSSSTAAAASYKMGSQSTTPPQPPQPPKESFARRYKFLWPLLLTVNLAVGAYLFMRTKKKDTDQEEEVSSKTPSSTPSTAAAPVSEKIMPSPIISEAVKLIEPVREDQQRELFKWILEEKRKVKPKDSEERKRIDDEKAILKQFIRAKSIPGI
ncbi:zinc finger protein [Salix suchowensis]|nr:zinc finger protein [Salix suchowensis]